MFCNLFEGGFDIFDDGTVHYGRVAERRAEAATIAVEAGAVVRQGDRDFDVLGGGIGD